MRQEKTGRLLGLGAGIDEDAYFVITGDQKVASEALLFLSEPRA